MTVKWLIDKSAFARLGMAIDAERWAGNIQRGLVAISTVTRLEIGFSARSSTEFETLFDQPPLQYMPIEYLTPAIEDRALAIQRHLATRGQHRAPSIPDLLIAATAELTGRQVLHMDKDFDLIANLTRQPMSKLEVTSN
ncbi:hypothetical protein SAMN06309944_1785 [Micrococcales bacterium KH10]|nr:hypothetical protein SAMN06309944_1785 [Micrococcales bacterium KH10]